MSEPRVAALVCEGQTDVPILEAVIQELWPSVQEVLTLQPELDQQGRAVGPAGWSEVKEWCAQNASSLDDVLNPALGFPIDLLLVAIDVDVAIEAGIANPPKKIGAYESARLQRTVQRWLRPKGTPAIPWQVVVSTPVMAIETWIIAALHPNQRVPESIPNPAEFLLTKKKLRRSPKNQKPWKELHQYRAFSAAVAAKLDKVRRACPEAERTCREIERRRDRFDS